MRYFLPLACPNEAIRSRVNIDSCGAPLWQGVIGRTLSPITPWLWLRGLSGEGAAPSACPGRSVAPKTKSFRSTLNTGYTICARAPSHPERASPRASLRCEPAARSLGSKRERCRQRCLILSARTLTPLPGVGSPASRPPAAAGRGDSFRERSHFVQRPAACCASIMILGCMWSCSCQRPYGGA